MTNLLRNPKTHYALLSGVGLILLLVWMQGGFEHKVQPGLSPQGEDVARPVGKVVAVERLSANETLSWPGTVAAISVTQVAAKLPGRIAEITVNAGGKVGRGQVLVRLDDRELRSRLDQARSAVAVADSEVGRTQADARRYQNLWNKQAATRQDLERTQAAAQSAEARARVARDAVIEAETALAEMVLRAPADSVVLHRDLEPGDMALPGVSILSLQQSRQMRVESAIPAQCAGLIKVGSELSVRLGNPDRRVAARVDEIQPAADPATRTVLIKARLPVDSGAESGAFAWVEQSCGSREAWVIPQAAISRIGQLETVRWTRDGKLFQVRHIRSGKVLGDGRVEVISGLRDGDQVLVAETSR